MHRLLALSLVAVAAAVIACGGDDGSAPVAPEPATSAGPEKDEGRESKRSGRRPQQPGTEIVVDGSQYGPMLFDAKQQAIYLFDAEVSDTPQCYGDCAVAWPPVLTEGEPEAGEGVDAELLGTTERDDGSTQVTYKGHPLYFYAHEGPGQVLCHNIAEFGGLWLVVQPNGEPAPA